MSSPKSQLPASSFVLLLVLLFNALVSLNASIVDYAYDVNRDGYYFRFKTSDGTERHEEAKLKAGEVLSIAGSYEYEADGYITIVTYIADENGFRPLSQIRKKIENQPLGFSLDNRIDPKLLGSLAGGGLG